MISLFLPALDSFERAFATPAGQACWATPGSTASHSSIWRCSTRYSSMESQQIETKPGQAFDPLRHQSIGEVESNEHPEGHIAVVLQSGYEVRGRVLRPTLVQLARPAGGSARRRC